MTLHLYTLSGSPFGWKVQLALEYKGVPYETSQLSPEKGDLKTPRFKALNPHGKLPVLVDDDLVLFESDAILAYVDEAFPAFGPNLWARDAKTRALQRMAGIEASNYLYPPIRALVVAWTRPDANVELEAIAAAKASVLDQLASFAPRLVGAFFHGDLPGAVDFTLFPLVALLKRLEGRRPEEGVGALIPPEIAAWRERFEALPAYSHTYPPHWSA